MDEERQGARPMETNTNVQWLRSYETGLEKCRAQNKPMMLDFFKDG
jgi:hypothetical protein